MSTKTRQTVNRSGETGATASSATAPVVRQPAGNAAAVERAGLGKEGAGALGGDIGAGLSWAWSTAKDMLGMDDSAAEDSWALARQTAENLSSAQGKLGELAGRARFLGLSEVAARLEGAAETLAAPAGLATDLTDLMQQAEKVAAVKRLLETTAAVISVDLADPQAAAVFDAWFAVVGAVGEEIADRGGMWGALLKPFASFIKMFGECQLFTQVRDNLRLHGTGRENVRGLMESHEEGF